MNQIKIYLLLSILINFVMICCGFLVGEFDGDLVDGMQMNIWMYFIGARDKYLMQAIDTKQNKFSIKTFSDDDNKLIIDFNGLTCNLKSSNKLGFREILLFKENNLYRNYYAPNNLLLSNLFNNISKNGKFNSTFDWPNAGDLHKMSDRTKFWFGYSNNQKIKINTSFGDSDSSKQKIIGCVKKFIVHNKKLKLEIKGNNFHENCWKDVIEIICQNGNCGNKKLSKINIIDCKHSLLGMNTARHCYGDISNNINTFHSYERIGNYWKSIIVKFAWITEQSMNQCLMEIITRNNLFIEIYLNSFNQTILAIKNDKSINWSNYILFEISSNQIHILRIEFTESDSTFKVSNGEFIKTLILPQLGSIKLINIGWSFGINFCQQLTSKYVLRYDSKQFRQLNESNVTSILLKTFYSRKPCMKVHYWILFFTMIISAAFLLLIGILLNCMICKIKKPKENTQRSTSNFYEELQKSNNSTQFGCAVVVKENIEIIYDE